MNSINGTTFKEMLAGGAKALEFNRALIDELNVFPVPDGDTGTNMSLTISTAMREVGLADTEEIHKIAVAFSKVLQSHLTTKLNSTQRYLQKH
ncbi:MAG: DAK2 domain-containing protein [Clostridia bacterium]|nr:DAK2 domain-containing protein [Clostridia bacterium]